MDAFTLLFLLWVATLVALVWVVTVLRARLKVIEAALGIERQALSDYTNIPPGHPLRLIRPPLVWGARFGGTGLLMAGWVAVFVVFGALMLALGMFLATIAVRGWAYAF